ncbi:MAG: hypothetical protein ACUBOA_08260 [Candidatus Loosdrechtia sp.]|uniref:hypothetical protein n=1 Tax=Candidatus Loosdrechtia sp. TaxID=3101272 RepID=UPI003A7A670A|nr:MAG: hypothetical protein QY305_06215 [Candidatus Jettenia sp. AMX2]
MDLILTHKLGKEQRVARTLSLNVADGKKQVAPPELERLLVFNATACTLFQDILKMWIRIRTRIGVPYE